MKTMPDSDHYLLVAMILHEIEENHKVPKIRTKMGSGEVTCSMTESAGYVLKKKKNRCNRI